MKRGRFARFVEKRLLPRMWVLWRESRRVDRLYRQEMKALEAKKAPWEERESLRSQWAADAFEIQEEIRSHETWQLLRVASRLHVPVPKRPYGREDDPGDENWEQESPGTWYLTPAGYSKVRNAIREERRARREAFLAWLPLIAAISGLIGILAGLAAVLQRMR